MTVGLMVITDGRRGCLERTLASLDLHIGRTRFDRRIVVNDCPDYDFCDWLEEQTRTVFHEHVRPQKHRRGFAGAIQAGWDHIGDVDWIFHLEDDFTFNRPVDLTAMLQVLRPRPQLAQMALRRQPWNAIEQAAGSYVAVHPDAYTDCSDNNGNHWLEQRLFFTTNPSIYRKSLTRNGWPITTESEGKFSHRLFEDPQVACGIWGQRTDSNWVTHIGDQRVGVGY